MARPPKNRPSPVPGGRRTPSGGRGSPRGEGGPVPRLRIDLYGHHAVREAVLNPERVVTAIYAAEGAGDELLDHVTAVRRQGVKRPEVRLVSRAALDAALPKDAVHQGVGVTVEPLAEADLDDLLRALPNGAPAVMVMLDQVTDPHNMGAIIRSACAFGARGLVVQRRHAPEPNAVMAKAACGALEHLPIAYETNLSRAIEALKEAGFTVFGLDETGDIDLPDLAPPARSVLVLGAEGPGLRRLIREGCDQMVRLPTQAPIGSLNVSNAAAVALYQLLCGQSARK